MKYKFYNILVNDILSNGEKNCRSETKFVYSYNNMKMQ